MPAPSHRADRIAGVVACLLVLVGCAASPARVDDLAAGVHLMTKRSGYFTGNTPLLKVEVEQDAAAYCRSRAGAVAIFDSRFVAANPPDFAYATVQFRCVAP